MAEPLRPHHPTDSGYRNWRDQRMCHCGSQWDDSIHDITENPAAQAEHRRRAGERDS